MNNSQIVKNGYIKINKKLENTTIFVLKETILLLKSKRYNYKNYFGKSGNRRLIKDNIRLYKSVKEHSKVLYTVISKLQLRFTGELIFLSEYEGNIESLRCEFFKDCGNYVSYQAHNRQFAKKCKKCFNKSILDSELSELSLYKKRVLNLTNYNYKKYKKIINPDNLVRGRNKYHLDHIYTVYDGFINNIPPFIIASPINLQMMEEYYNISKGNSSNITKEELFEKYYD